MPSHVSKSQVSSVVVITAGMWETTKLQPRVPLRVRSHGFRQQRSQPPLQCCMATLYTHSSTLCTLICIMVSKVCCQNLKCQATARPCLAPCSPNAWSRADILHVYSTICKLNECIKFVTLDKQELFTQDLQMT